MDTYDASGNPTSYYNGERYTMTWEEGRRLNTVAVSNRSYTYEYNADGQRIKKTDNSDDSYVEYYVMDGVTVGEAHFASATNKTMSIRYTLDESNSPIGISVNEGTGWVKYYFAKNLQGDVLAVYRESDGAVVARYTYDSWGNVVHATGALALTNPFRYRSYYYDEETNFYYLQSRYYDAAMGRFINADAYTSTGQGLLGNNMFAYCGNNPVMHEDPSGELWRLIPMIIPFILAGCNSAANEAPEGYVQENSTYHNCYSYAFGLSQAALPGMYSISDDPKDYYGGDPKKTSYTLGEIEDYILRDMAHLGIEVRPVNSPSDRNENEYIVAMKTSSKIAPGAHCPDIHFAILLENGMWADKQGTYPSRWGAIDGYAQAWDIDPGDGYYDSGTKYYAVGRKR